MRISDWSSDVCSSDLAVNLAPEAGDIDRAVAFEIPFEREVVILRMRRPQIRGARRSAAIAHVGEIAGQRIIRIDVREIGTAEHFAIIEARSEEHTSELQSLMRIAYAVFCLKHNKTIDKIP